ncbi:MAG: flagellar hook-length control protein FliK [Colwellia sp.]|nr:flagellar hook-length control protein FliK [Colwellia sp.]
MPQVNTLAIDIAPSNDYSSAQSGKSAAQNSASKDFSQVIDEHYQVQQSGKKSESSGNSTKNYTDTHADNTSSSAKNEAGNTPIKDKYPKNVADKKIIEENNTEQVTSAKPSTNENSESENSHSTDISEQSKSDNIVQTPVTKDIDNSQTSAEQLISLLSASEKILSTENKQQKSVNKESELKGQEKNQTKTDIDALLRQVLLGNDKKQSSERITTDTSSNDVSSKPKVTAEVNIGEIVNKEKTEQQLTNAADKTNETEFAEKAGKSTNDKQLNREVTDKITNVTADKTSNRSIDKAVATDKSTDKMMALSDKENTSSKAEYSTNEVEALLTSMKNTSTEAELAQAKALFSAEQERISAANKGNATIDKVTSFSEKPVITSTNSVSSQSITIENITNEDGEVLASITSNKAAFAGVSVSGEKQAQESNQNHSRVINQATQKVIEQQTPNMGNSSQDQSSSQQNKSTSESIITPEKLVVNEVPINEKQFNELFDKKLVNTGLESSNNRDNHQINEATKSTASAEEMITKLANDTAQSTAQSVTNAKQITSLQNEALSVYRKDFAGSVKDKVMVMMNQKLQQIEIRLDPQELGNVHVKINLQNEQAVVSFTVQNQQAKEAFDQNLGRLKEMLAESGVDVGDANVEQQNKQSDEEQLGGSGHSRGGDDNHEDLSGLSDTKTINLVKGSSTGVDYYA